jgi:hypothetical protein
MNASCVSWSQPELIILIPTSLYGLIVLFFTDSYPDRMDECLLPWNKSNYEQRYIGKILFYTKSTLLE